MNTEPKPNGFLTTLQRHRGGVLLADLSEKLTQLVASVAETGKSGSLTLKLTVAPAKKGHCAVVLTDNRGVLTLPKIEPESSFWFATGDGRLQTEDPRQRQMFSATEVVAGGKETENSVAFPRSATA